jgi:putative ABC transport system ATP-binding protein
MNILSVRELTITRAVAGQSFTVSLPSLDLSAGDLVAVTGASGCGKSTLVEALGLILRPMHVGAFMLCDTDVSSLLTEHSDEHSDVARAHLRRQHIGFVPQSHGLLPYLSVDQNIDLQARLSGKSLDTDWMVYARDRLGLHGLGSRLPRDLSLGQRQRVSFLRALSHQPDLLLADEPTAALDPGHARELFEIMLELIQTRRIATLVVTHEWDLLRSLQLRELRAHFQGDSRVEFVA